MTAKLIGAALLAAGLAGCAAGTHAGAPAASERNRLSPSATAYVALPADKRNTGVGPTVSSIVAGAFKHHMARVEQAAEPQTYEQSLEAARKTGAAYLVIPEIHHWKERRAERSGKADRAEIRLEVIDAASEDVIATGLITGRSTAALGGNTPQDILSQPTADYVDTLF